MSLKLVKLVDNHWCFSQGCIILCAVSQKYLIFEILHKLICLMFSILNKLIFFQNHLVYFFKYFFLKNVKLARVIKDALCKLN